jgi:hypothetical protein
MYTNQFTACGRLSHIESMERTGFVRLKFDTAGPVKVVSAVEVRDASLIATITSPEGFKVGDTVFVNCQLVLDESTQQLTAIVNTAPGGISRIARGPAAAPRPAQAAPVAAQVTQPQAQPQPTSATFRAGPTAVPAVPTERLTLTNDFEDSDIPF